MTCDFDLSGRELRGLIKIILDQWYGRVFGLCDDIDEKNEFLKLRAQLGFVYPLFSGQKNRFS